MLNLRLVLRAAAALTLSLVIGVTTFVGSGCATGSAVNTTQDDDSSPEISGPGGAGGTTSAGGTDNTGGGEMAGPCGIDCSSIQTDDCHVGVCNEQLKQCEIVPAEDGIACDDGLFCTTDDSCSAGNCVGGPPNDCELDAPECHDVICNESSQSCSSAPAADGSSCMPTDMCMVNATCSNGLCSGPLKDCFLAPKPSACYTSVCDSTSGDCVPVPGNDGDSCTDPYDLCTVGKTCSGGNCIGGQSKDCSSLTTGCFNGLCLANSGNCVQQPVPPGGTCADASDQCNVGICDSNGFCNPTAANLGNACNDADNCTTGETCQQTGQTGTCLGGSTITSCTNGDGCCPGNCNEVNDDDCSCNENLGLTASGTSSGGGQDSYGYGPLNFNDSKGEAYCMQNGCGQCFAWVSNGQSANGAFIQYDWTSSQTIGSIYIETDNATSPMCGTGGRNIESGTVQWWNGSSWQTASTFQSQSDDVQLSFSPKLNTTKLRVYDITASPGNGNSIIFEWYVYAGSNCSP